MSAFVLDISEDGLAVVTFDLPGEKVNKFSRDVLAELDALVSSLARDTRVRALLLESGKADVFIAGADVKEFVTPRSDEVESQVRQVQALFQRWSLLPYPTIAVIGGACLGGGTEIALACDYRLMSDSKKARIGLPEVRLGIFPAWGGCTRLPRLVGLASSLDLILTGKTLDARRAARLGLVDVAVPTPILDDYARRFARMRIGTGKPPTGRRVPPRLSERALEATSIGRRVVFHQARKRVLDQTGGHYPAPLEAIAVIEEGWGKPVEKGLDAEARHIARIFGGEAQKNLLALFFATEEVKKDNGVADAGIRPRPVTRVGLLGAGLMGGGIAQLAADRGLPARMKDIDPKALAHGFAAAASLWKDGVKKRRLNPQEASRKMALLSGTLDYTGFARCEVTIEAVLEKVAVKRSVLKEWEAVVPRDAIFASNTSTIPISEIAAEAAEPARVVGMHFFNPVHRMPLVEVIRGSLTSAQTVATVFSLAKALGKTPVVVKDSPGFLVNRILAPYLSEAVRLIAERCAIEEIDGAMTDFGMPVGPIALLDDVGLDVAAKAGEVLQAAFPDRMKAAGEARLAAEGRLGRKSGKGFYDYENGKRRRPAREAYGSLGVEPLETSPVSREEIQSRLVFLMVNEAAYCLEDQVVATAGKLDLAMILGTGFPAFRGGLLRYADSIGASRVVGGLEALSRALGPRFRPSPLLLELAGSGDRFYTVSLPQEKTA